MTRHNHKWSRTIQRKQTRTGSCITVEHVSTLSCSCKESQTTSETSQLDLIRQRAEETASRRYGVEVGGVQGCGHFIGPPWPCDAYTAAHIGLAALDAIKPDA